MTALEALASLVRVGKVTINLSDEPFVGIRKMSVEIEPKDKRVPGFGAFRCVTDLAAQSSVVLIEEMILETVLVDLAIPKEGRRG